ncbi:MATE family efflux transporter [Pelistega europaea]|uniref:Multidrug-efflux transporter n=1 Tax=Pelistega europaea TaxID=106147 RepID=A0A7Y4LAX1_9BURK|nr:MATE family efflux transporter [Pelistega europaea]NOL50163.1 MATE family efflux transporter [Pelistega europaea]
MTQSTPQIRKSLIQQAWPILIGQWASMAFGVLDTMMLGNFNAQSLQAMSLAASIFITVNVSLMGVVHALIPITSQLFGAQKNKEIGVMWGQGIWLALFLSLTVGLLLLFPDQWLRYSGRIDPEVRNEVTNYLLISFFAIPAALMFRAVYALCTSASRPKHVMYINVASIAVKALLNWALIFGHLGLPSLGSVGAALSTMIVSWFTLFLGLWIVFSDGYYRQFELQLGLPKIDKIIELLKLGLPMGGSYFVEVSAFTFMALLVSREGTFVAGGHQIMSNLAAILYMMPQSIGIATAALSAHAIGRRDYPLSHRISTQGLLLGFSGAVISSLIVFFGKPFIIYLYTNDTQVALMAASLLTLMPFFHLFDHFQCIITYILRAHKIATIPFMTQTVLLLGLGLGGGYYFGYGSGYGLLAWLSHIVTPNSTLGVSSLWIMCCVALASCGAILALWYRTIIRRLLVEK